MPTFDIIMVTWNRADYTKRTVASLITSGAYDACQRFIVIDNKSQEQDMAGFLEALTLYKKTFIIQRPTNDGWATAVNDALGCSRAEYVLLINNDVEFNVGFIDEMFKTYKNQAGIGILGAWRHISHSFVGIINDWFKQMDNVPAVCWLMPKSAMEKVGMLTEKGVCLTKGGNGEDTDYVLRMQAAGLLTGVTKYDVAHHIDGY